MHPSAPVVDLPSAGKRFELRIEKARTLALAALIIAFTAWFTPGQLALATSEATFQSLRKERADERRCVVCSMSFEAYSTLSWGVVLVLNGFLLPLTAVGLLRAFGPPTLTVTGNGRGRYTLPWRSRDFQIADGTLITVGQFAMTFDPPLAVDGGELRNAIRIRANLTNKTRDEIAAELGGLNASWVVR